MQIPSSHLSLQKENTAIKKEKKKIFLPPALPSLASATQESYIGIKKKKKMNLNCFTK